MLKILLRIKGFSLIELLITVTIIAILASLTTYSYGNYRDNIIYSNSINRLNQELLAIYKFYSANKRCPNSNLSDTPSPFINISLTPTNNYFGDSILSNQCDLTLRRDTTTIITLQANTVQTLNNAFNEGIQYTCIVNNSLTDREIGIINKHLQNCHK